MIPKSFYIKEYAKNGWLIPPRRGFLDGWWSVLFAFSLLAAESDSWCVDPPVLWTVEAWSEEDWEAACSSCLPRLFFAASRLCLERRPATVFSHWCASAFENFREYITSIGKASSISKLMSKLELTNADTNMGADNPCFLLLFNP